MLEIEPLKNRPYSVRVNGTVYTQTSAHRSNTPWSLDTRNKALRDVLSHLSISQIREQIFMFSFDLHGLQYQPLESGYLYFGDSSESIIELRKTWALLSWQQPYTVGQFADAVKYAAASFEDFQARGTTEGDEGSFTIGIEFPLPDCDELLKDVLARVGPQAQQVFEKAQDEMRVSIPAGTLVTYFRFPEPVRAACLQYLMYFTQFLQDLGIEASAEVKQQTQQVLFTVVPDSGEQALQQISEALQIYLSLPTALPAVPAPTSNDDLALVQLHRVVEHLRAQTGLLRAQLEFNDATIDQLRLTNYQYRQTVLSGGVSAQVPPSRDPKKEPGDPEPLVGRIVTLKKLSLKWVDINLPELLRMLKRKWRR